MEKQTQSPKRRRLVLVPYPYQGHITPMLQLGTFLHNNGGFSITIAHTRFNSPDPSNYPYFQFLFLEDEISKLEAIPADLLDVLSDINVNCRASFEDQMRKLIAAGGGASASAEEEEDSGEVVAGVIRDELMFFCEEIASDLKLRSFVLRTTSAAASFARIALVRLNDEGYFPLKGKGANPSLTWKSILWGRELFKRGYRWRVGNGRHIYIGDDPWVPNKGNFKPSLIPESFKLKRVAELIGESGEWEEGFIRSVFLPHDAEDILNIPLGNQRAADEIIWNPDSKGKFSVKSAYRLGSFAGSSLSVSSSDRGGLFDFWRALWKLDLMPRIKIGVWRILNDIIPTAVNLARKGVDANLSCLFCRKSVETTCHLLGECRFVKRLWQRFFPSYVSLFHMGRGRWSTFDYWDCIKENTQDEDLRGPVILMWNIWQRRNQIRVGSEQADLESMVLSTERLLEIHLQESRPSLGHAALAGRRQSACWRPPQTGSWKMNADAAWSESLNRGGIGWVVRDWNGTPIIGGMTFVDRKWSVKVLEAKAVVDGLKQIASLWEGHNPPLVVESDSLEVIRLLNRSSSDLSEVRLFIDEALSLVPVVHCGSFCKIPREENKAAHNLAALASSSGNSVVWNLCFPAEVLPLILEGGRL